MKLEKILCTIAVIFTLSSLFIAVSIIRSHRNLRKEIEHELLSEQSIVENSSLSMTLSQSVDAGKEINTSDRKDTRMPSLNLRLLGTILGDPSIAYIEDLTSKREGAYKVGDIISGAKIVDIQTGKVILDRNGYREFLVFAESREEAIIGISPTERIVSKKGILKEIGSDINKTLTMARVLPHFDFASRRFSGFKVDGIQKGSIIEKAGLRNGDVVKVVNEQRLNSPQRAIQVFRKVRNQSQIDVDLLRKNQLIRLRYEIRD